MNQRNRIVLPGRQLDPKRGGIDGLAPFKTEAAGGETAALGDIEPFVGEGSIHAAQNFFLHEVAEGSFHDAPSAAGAEINGILCIEKRLEVWLN